MKRIFRLVLLVCFIFVPFVDGANAETSTPIEPQEKPGTAT
ncbi:Uncharacterised protein [Niallia circulans]|jgi:hypothetical protein|uniref:Uncharacterized protein n=1 Tax=Shouchella rhizosphaerae TaxID=866786 RepID=A0ABZ2CYW9_9BACI|nr:hypothetical protein [Shouchella clausii]MEB5471467.1 hypothetical protein [Shouchella clausii]WQG94866.1 hypothetical protein SR921_20345 [Shouchella clausii]SPU17803.1 Uncharacterised protein [Niallia circulans]